MFSREATKFDTIFTVVLTLVGFKSKVKISSIFVALLEKMNFNTIMAGLLGVFFSEKWSLSFLNFFSDEDLSILCESWDIQLIFDTLANVYKFEVYLLGGVKVKKKTTWRTCNRIDCIFTCCRDSGSLSIWKLNILNISNILKDEFKSILL